MRVSDLKPDPRNARRHSPRNLQVISDSLRQVGAARSIVIDENDIILAGNGVVSAAGDAGIENVRIIDADGDELIAVRRSGLSADQKTRLALADNRAGELSEFDPDELSLLNDDGFDFDGLFDEDELGSLLGEAGETEARNIDDGDGEPTKKPTLVRVILSIPQVRILENAIDKTSARDRADAMMEICQFYLDAGDDEDR